MAWISKQFQLIKVFISLFIGMFITPEHETTSNVLGLEGLFRQRAITNVSSNKWMYLSIESIKLWDIVAGVLGLSLNALSRPLPRCPLRG